MFNLFGLPIKMFTINPDDFDKTKLVSDVLDNYKISKTRNKWDDESNIHHENSDWNNDNFKKLDYSKLIPIYNKFVHQYLSQFKWKNNFKFTYEIENYTCMGKGQFMKKHLHGSDFTAIHYLKYNKKHKSTRFYNPNPSVEYFELVTPNLRKNLDESHILNSWAFKSWYLDVEENHICFAPSSLLHGVPQQQIDDLRITIVLNIYTTPLEEKENE